jgi:sec-independent protein translocase protein TatA
MGPVGLPEMAVIFVIALVLFGPKKLPELGRMLGTAISHFRRVRSEMKAAFDRELQNLELQARSQKIDSGHRYDNGNYDYSSSGASVGAEVFASSSAESRDSTISRVYTTEEPARPAGGVHEAGIGVISREA